MSSSRVLVYGGRGALGSAVVDFFKSKSWVREHEGRWMNYTAVLSLLPRPPSKGLGRRLSCPVSG